VEANREQWRDLSARGFKVEGGLKAAENMPEFTPVEEHGGLLVKRDDLFCVGGVRGGKVRSCWQLAKGATGLVTAGSRSSPQVNIVAHIAQELGIPCRVHCPSGALSPEVLAAQGAGAEVLQHKPGYNTVIVKRAKDDAAAQGWREIPFGMECQEAVNQTRDQVASLPWGEFKRIVIPVGSGMSLSGLLWGLEEEEVPVLGVVVGADPTTRLDKWAPSDWRDRVTLVASGKDYHAEVAGSLGDLLLDPVYEAKCLPFLEQGDLLWVIGIRQTSETGEQREPPAPSWIQGDSLEVASLTGEEGYDLLFTCPPYFDLEQYSDDPQDLSNAPSYEAFLESYEKILKASAGLLTEDRFAVVVAGNVRAKKGGFYTGFVRDTIRVMEEAGAKLYNDAILVTAAGSLPIRAGKIFKAGRKLGATHQRVLVFYKGDPSKIRENLGEVQVAFPEADEGE